METAQQIEELVRKVVEEEGLELFDLEIPGRPGGTLRVFLSRPGAPTESNVEGKVKGVGLEECARVSRRLAEMPELDELFPGSYLLEVSSPGVNRKLRRPDHFAGAIGERVKLTVQGSVYEAVQGKPVKGKRVTVIGTLVAVDPKELAIDDEGLKRQVRLPLDSISEARVDFKFE